ncbi:MAG: NAD(P)-dependent glycerol-1-phosphate dehydrogenase [Candidatus Methanoplasma sp.]|jgi:glycerol-1-phosphate dehydrogenase [NAD(P)+]|nr:NAD(P)-dependent glycerol-1-phosphate dehydrogenase [Candidatus Methanoplasma sp.]
MAAFTKKRSMEFPRNVWLGHNATDEVADVCRNLQFGKNGLIVTGEDTYKAAGKKVEDLASESYDIAAVLTGNATYENVAAVEEAAKEHKAKFLLAVGGGSKIDISKMVAKDLNIPLISIPTSVAHDGIASDRASIKSGDGSRSVGAVSPIAIIADTTVINDAPYKYLAAGCADVVSNLTALRDWELANRTAGDEMSSSAYTIAKYAAEEIISSSRGIKPGLEESVWLVLKPIIASGVSMLIAGSSRPTSGSEHMFSHALDVIRPETALHGQQCGVGSIMMMKLQGGDWERIRDALKNIGAPTTAEELGFTDEEIIKALVMAKDMRDDRFTILERKKLTEKTAKRLARATGVI